jgi:hypothetical protein
MKNKTKPGYLPPTPSQGGGGRKAIHPRQIALKNITGAIQSLLPLLGRGLGGGMVCLLCCFLLASCTHESTTHPSPVAFHLPMTDATTVGEAGVWVFTPDGTFLYDAEGSHLTATADGLHFAATLPTGRYTLVVTTDARSLVQAAYPQGIPRGMGIEEMLKSTTSPQATSPQVGGAPAPPPGGGGGGAPHLGGASLGGRSAL